MIRDSISRRARHAAALGLLVAGALLALPTTAHADGDLEAKRGVVRPREAPAVAAPSKEPGREVIVLDPTRRIDRRRRAPEDVTPTSASPVAIPSQETEMRSGWLQFGWRWIAFTSR